MTHAQDRPPVIGWSRRDGIWIELQHPAGAIITPAPVPPELTPANVAKKLNELETEAATWRPVAAMLAEHFSKEEDLW